MRQYLAKGREETRRLLRSSWPPSSFLAAVGGVPCRTQLDRDHCQSNSTRAGRSGRVHRVDSPGPRPLRVNSSAVPAGRR